MVLWAKFITPQKKLPGEEEVIRKVRFIRQHDLKRGILITQKEITLVGN